MKCDFENRTEQVHNVDLGVLEEAHGDRLLARLLQARGVASAKDAHEFLHPGWEYLHDPFAFRDMQKAVKLIKDAVSTGRNIQIFGDYDADGTCASAILALTLRKMGASATVNLPSRTRDGYGVSSTALEAAPEGALMITVDCGITATEQIERAKERGMDVILTDHHICPDFLPTADCILNPKVPDEPYPDQNLCGAGIAFKLSQALIGEDAKEYVDLAGIATIGDVVPLVGENRSLAWLGLEKINSNPTPGLGALKKHIWPNGKTISSQDIAFSIVPALNAPGRVSSARVTYDLLVSPAGPMADLKAQLLCSDNDERKAQQERVLESAMAQLKAMQSIPNFIVLYGDEWPYGVLGPVAGKLTEDFARPVILLTKAGKEEEYQGSARSVAGINMHEVLQMFSNLIEKFGGHAGAAGLSVLSDNMAQLRSELEVYGKKHAEQFLKTPMVAYDVEASIPFEESMLQTFEQLEPFGCENPEPALLVRDVSVSNVRGMKNDKHASFDMVCARNIARGVMFNTSPRDVPAKADIVGNLQLSTYSNQLELIVRAMRDAGIKSNAQFFAEAIPTMKHAWKTLPAELYFRDKKRLGVIYSAIIASRVPEEGMSRADLYVTLRAKIPDLRREETLFAWAVFSELNLIGGLHDDKIKVVRDPAKKHLEDSVVYRKFEERARSAKQH